VRTPMPWDSGHSAGFTTGEPWLPLGADHPIRNVAVQEADPRSMLSLYRRLIALRRAEAALAIGAYHPVAATEQVLAYERRHRGERLGIALNLTNAPAEVSAVWTGEILLSTGLGRDRERLERTLRLAPDEGVVVRLSA
jgi:alpha-glucosidase